MLSRALLIPALALASCVSTQPKRVDPGLDVQYQVEGRAALGGETAGPLAWGLPGANSAGLASASFDRPGSGATQDPQGENEEQRNARLRTEFGSSVLIGKDGRVTKQYFLAGDLAPTFLKLIAEIQPGKPVAKAAQEPPAGTKVGGPESRSVLGRMLGEYVVEVTYVPEFEVLSGGRIVDPAKGSVVSGEPFAVKAGPKVALALITAQPSALKAFEAALDLFYGSIPQIEITVQVVEYTTADALAFGVTGIDNTTPVLSNLTSGQLVRSFTSIFPRSQPIVGATPVTDVGLFTLGGIHDSWELNMVLEALEANNIADIQSSPKLVVRNGGIAAISTLTQVPFPKARINQLGANVATDISFKPVGVKMNIVPTIAGTDSVILQIYADVSAITGFADTDPVVTPITSQRTAVTTVYLKDKHTLVIGGLKSETTFESETKVPLLGDIPLLGFLFRSTSTQRSETQVEFYITPRIMTSRGDPTGSSLW
ncbi:MAG: hypothetical protein NXI31_13090 [bacterium]|nr:hypothetical protein [bacterium]